MSELNCISKFKQVLGEVIYARPTGNNARWWDGDLVEFTVSGVGRKYVELDRGGSIGYYLPENGATKDSVRTGHAGNSGYMFFLTKEEHDKFADKLKLAGEVSKKVRYFNFKQLKVDDLRVIEEILKPFN